MAMVYRKLTYLVAAELAEELTARLWEEGTLGTQVHPAAGGRLRLEAWFPGPKPQAGAGGGAAILVAVEELPEQDWLASYRRQAVPFPLGRRFFVDPGEPDGPPVEPPTGRWLLRLPARSAFGTGSHESTRLAVELLEEAPPAGLTVLDLGTGTGILSFAALLLGARRAVGFDVDPGAALVAEENLHLNRVLFRGARPAFFAGEVAALAAGVRFDLAVVNVLPEKVAGAFPALAARLAPAGGMILSGLLGEQAPGLLERLGRLGLHPAGERRAGEWIALRLMKDARGEEVQR